MEDSFKRCGAKLRLAARQPHDSRVVRMRKRPAGTPAGKSNLKVSAMSSTIAPSATRQAAARTSGIPVLPAVDENLGAVTFRTPEGFHAYWTAEPRQLVEALGQAVRPARWIPEIGTLVVTVAQTGVRTGRGLGFRLATY